MPHDFESWGVASIMPDPEPQYIAEVFNGASVVSWYDSIDRQLDAMIQKYEQNHQHDISDRVRTFLNTWRENEITGSLNRENIEPLKSAAEQLGADDWKLKPYFSNLRGQLRKLEASLEELPADQFPTPEPAEFPTQPPSQYGPQAQPPGQGPAGAPPAQGQPPPGSPPPPPP